MYCWGIIELHGKRNASWLKSCKICSNPLHLQFFLVRTYSVIPLYHQRKMGEHQLNGLILNQYNRRLHKANSIGAGDSEVCCTCRVPDRMMRAMDYDGAELKGWGGGGCASVSAWSKVNDSIHLPLTLKQLTSSAQSGTHTVTQHVPMRNPARHAVRQQETQSSVIFSNVPWSCII